VILVVGSTGALGGEICRMLRERGDSVRAFVRTTSNATRVKALRDLGCEIAIGDLQDRASIDRACNGVEAVVSTATTVVSRQSHDSLQKSDLEGHFALIDYAEKYDVKRFVLISISGNVDAASGLQKAKREVEEKLRESGVSYTILRPSFFMEVWLSPMLGFDAANGAVRVYGAGVEPISFISMFDVASFAVQSIDNERVANRTIELGGPEAITPDQVVKVFEKELSRTITVTHVPAEALSQQYESAADDYQKSFAGFMLTMNEGDEIDSTDALRRIPMKLKSVRDYARSLALSTGAISRANREAVPSRKKTRR